MATLYRTDAYSTKADILRDLLAYPDSALHLLEVAARLAATDPSTISDNSSRLTTGNAITTPGGAAPTDNTSRWPAYSTQSAAVAAIRAAAPIGGVAVDEVIHRIERTNLNNWGGG